MKTKLHSIIIAALLFCGNVSHAQHTVKESLAKANDTAVAAIAVNDSVALDSLDSVLAAPDSLPYPARAQQKIAQLLENDMFNTSQVGLMVVDMDADSVLFAHNERQLMRPASTMKLITAISALDHLGRKHRFRTELLYCGERDSTSLNGNIYLRGGMDPALEMYDIDCFAEGVASLGVDTIRGGIVTDNSFKDTKMMGEGWCWDDENPLLAPLTYKRKDNVAELLRHKLADMGIVVMGNDSTGTVPQGAKTLTERFTSIEHVLERMMKNSDNAYAEAVYYQLGALHSLPSTAKKAREMERQTMLRAGLKPGNYRLADGSGLSLYNYLSAECLTNMLRYAYKEKGIFGILCQSLPSAGVDGTLKNRMKKDAVRDNVRAKTGTLTGIYSLAGYCTAPNGHMITFAIINQGVMHAANARRFQDRVCEALCE